MSSVIYLCNPSVTVSHTAISGVCRHCNIYHLKEILQPEQRLLSYLPKKARGWLCIHKSWRKFISSGCSSGIEQDANTGSV